MIKKLFFLLACGGLLLAANCNDGEPGQGSLEMNFKGTFDTAPLVMYESTYAYEDNTSLKFQLFQFYLSDIVLIKDDDSTVPVEDVALISFKDILNPTAAAAGINFAYNKIPEGHYKGIRVGVGVAPNLNSTTPASYMPPHPLDDNYWSASLGYVFTKIEGNADLAGNGEYTTKLTFHSGANSIYKEKTFDKHFEVKEGTPLHFQFDVDLKKVIAKDANNFLNFREVTMDHSNNPAVFTFIADNLFDALILE